MGIWETIEREKALIAGAPWSCASLVIASLVAGSLAGYWFSSTLYAERLATMQERLDYRQEKLDDANQKLTEAQMSALIDGLSASPSTVTVPEGWVQGDLDTQIIEAFQKSGWTVEVGAYHAGADEALTVEDKTAQDAVLKTFKDLGIDYKAVGRIEK
ncbi:hypothetical protein ACLIR7_09575 [Nitratireductor aquimarinus]|uniref:hypothetical protein n=1 Tax=Nitratireductor aquimarinus TaxID=889300 RepID=UPI00398F51FA